MPITHPPVLINEYLAQKIEAGLPDRFSDAMRFFPTQPTDINALTEQFPSAADNVFAVYDRMFRLRRKPFPHVKKEQLLYYFYKMAGDPEALIETIAIVFELLDRGDESAQDVNQWLRMQYNRGDTGTKIALKKTNQNTSYVFVKEDPDDEEEEGEYYEKEGDVVEIYDAIKINDQPFMLPYFHEFRIFQLEEARDIIAFGTARTYAGNKLILDYTWHQPAPKETHKLPDGFSSSAALPHPHQAIAKSDWNARGVFKGDWSSGTTYSENEAVWLEADRGPIDQFSSSSESEYGKIWISLQNSNRGNTPAEGSSFWISLQEYNSYQES